MTAQTSRCTARRLAWSVGLAALVAALLVTMTPPAGAAATTSDASPFPMVRELHLTDCVPNCRSGARLAETPTSFNIDTTRRTVIVQTPSRVNLVDADDLVQEDSLLLSPGLGQTAQPAYDTRRQRLLFGEAAPGVASAACPSLPISVACPVTASTDPTSVKAFSLETRTTDPTGEDRAALVAETTLPQQFNGHRIASVVYDRGTDLVFVASHADVTSLQTTEVWIHAIDAGAMASPPPPAPDATAVRWSYKVEGCGMAPSGAPLGVGTEGDFAYVLCRDPVSPAIGAASSRPSLHAVAVVDFRGADPRLPNVSASFSRLLSPFAGDYTYGRSFVDPRGDRVVAIVSGGGAQRMYVFDARHRAWTGSILLGKDNVAGGTADPATGRAYSLDERLGVIATDIAPVPVLQGKVFSLGFKPNIQLPAFDALTRRLFVVSHNRERVDERGQPLGGNVTAHLSVFEDRTAPYVDPPPADPDAATNDIDEADASSVSHTGGGSAYGARVMWVGGVRAAPLVADVEPRVPWSQSVPGTTSSVDLSDVRPEGGDRGLFFGQVTEAQLAGSRDGGTAKATAVGASIDDQTESDLDGKLGAPFSRAGQSPPAEAQWSTIKANINETQPSSCLDLGGENDPRTASKPGSSATCKEREEVNAVAESSQQMGDLPFQVGYAASDVRLALDDEKGVLSTATAIARGVHLAMPGVGSISIGEVVSVASTQAKGRPGTAASTLETAISHVRIVDANGEGFSCTQCDPVTVVDAINARFPMRVQALGPRPATDELITGSPGGAKAVIEKDLYAMWNDANVNGDSRAEVAGLTLVVYNDAKEASRYIVQLGAVLAESQYKVGAPLETFTQDPSSLALELLDEAGAPLAGGVFELRKNAVVADDCLADSTDTETTDDTTTSTTAPDGEGSTTTTTAASTKADETTTTTETGDEEDEESEEESEEEGGLPLPTIPGQDTDVDSDGDDEGDGTDDDGCPAEDAPGDDTTTTTAPADDATTTTTADETTTTTTTTEGDGSTTTTTTEGDGSTTTTVPDETTSTTAPTDVVDELADELVPEGSCVTGEDGVGDCVFEHLAPGDYIVRQTTAPAGYAPVADFPVNLAPGMASKVSFTNLKALASIEISLTDDADPPAPLPGGVFVILADDGDGVLGAADVELGRCTTGADGTCEPFVDVPLGAYVAHQETAPNGLLPAGDVPFALDLPGQVAAIAFVNGLPPSAPAPAAEVATGGGASFDPAPSPSFGTATYIPPPPPPAPVVTSTPIPDPPSGLGRVLSLPSEAASFLARSPGDAALFAGIWSLLLAPAYLVARRRKLTLVKEI